VIPVADDSFEAVPGGEGFLFGGLTLGTALQAAAHTVAAGLVPKSLHAYFLRPGRWGPALRIDVGRTADGRSFASRHATVRQDDRTLAVLSLSFHRPGAGADWQASSELRGPKPAELSAMPVHMPWPDLIEVRTGRGPEIGSFASSAHPYWARSVGPLGEDPPAHSAAVAFMSDFMVVMSVLDADAEFADPEGIVTLDHGLWFHRAVNAEDWLLFSSDPVSIASGRGFVRGAIHAQDGQLIASFAQEVHIPSEPATGHRLTRNGGEA
jgi:acyl-CoA thioesterase